MGAGATRRSSGRRSLTAALAEIAPDGLDLIVEVDIAANAALDVQVAKSRTAVAIYANDGGNEFRLDTRANMIKNMRYQFVLLYSVGDLALREAVADVTRARLRRARAPSVRPRRHCGCSSGRRGWCGRQGSD